MALPKSRTSPVADLETKVAELTGVRTSEVRDFAYVYVLERIIKERSRSRRRKSFIVSLLSLLVFLGGIALAIAYLLRIRPS